MRGHRSRVSSLSWNGPLVSSGRRDASIHHYDVRAPQQAAELHGHTQEVCGLKWSPQGTQLASGGNDNILNIWEARRNQSRFTIARHQAAVKALAWCPPHPTRPFALSPVAFRPLGRVPTSRGGCRCPFQANLLASGGGTADRRICLWNTGNGQCLNEVDTKSQVRVLAPQTRNPPPCASARRADARAHDACAHWDADRCARLRACAPMHAARGGRITSRCITSRVWLSPHASSRRTQAFPGGPASALPMALRQATLEGLQPRATVRRHMRMRRFDTCG